MESTLINKNELEHSKLRDQKSSKDIKVVTAPAQISAVPPWSLAAEIGLEPGDKIIAINGNKLRDIMDFEFQFRQNDELELLIKKPDESEIIIELEKDPDDVLGVEFHTPLFNGVQECANKCPFCFIENQPYEQTRESLHLRDDDFRLSYLHGSYVTLTNLSFSDRKRIEELRPGPLYVSVHATDPEVRNKMLGRKKSPPIIDELKWLDSLGIPVHTQVVLCPEMNDGKHLLQTIKELYALKDSPVLSLAVVPVGLTKFHRGGLRRFTTDEAFAVVDMVQKWEAENPKHANFVFLSDEWFLMTHSPIPEQNYYGEYPQLEDGVGMTRLFLNEVEAELRSLGIVNRGKGIGKKVSWINGSMSKPIVDQVSSKINQALTGIELKPICLDSLFWGTTNVSGLLTGNDIYSALKYVPKEMLGELIIIPSVMLKDRTEIFLDDMSLQELETKLGLPCKKAWGAKELIEVVTSL
ncbi:MAG: DUF512 domain-containing protein [Cyanobacteria bacterium]|nr:DUF512 domain-containing protein [Cyanobacteriota bacterium]MDA1020984.1 DUF512 domain-containing protein [Cyanobacteriota bacterium]